MAEEGLRIGLTGGIGCGKTTVVGLFAAAGWRTLQSDEIVQDLLEHDESLREQLRMRWGCGVFDINGSVLRKAVAAIVFEEDSELEWLESQLHPKVREYWTTAIAAEGERAWLVEIPLLFEKSLETLFDFSVCVASSDEVVASRMLARGYTAEQVEQRRLRQMPLSDKISRADFLISNLGTLEFLKLQTNTLINRFE